MESPNSINSYFRLTDSSIGTSSSQRNNSTEDIASYSSSSNNSSTDNTVTEKQPDLILEDIVQALDAWTVHVFTLDSELQYTSNLKKNVTEYLQKQILDGLLKREDATELEYVLDLWTNLHRAYVCKQIGAEFADQSIFTYLLELFSLKQISKQFVIRILLEICRR